MIKVLFPDGVEVFADDLAAIENYREAETERRWNHIVETPGIVTKRFDTGILEVSTGATTGTCQVAAGGAYMPSGEYVYCSGASVTGLTDASLFPAGTTYLAVQHTAITGNTRPYQINGVDMLPTREWNAQGSGVGGTCIALKNTLTGSNYIVIAKITSISAEGDVVLDTGATYRQVYKIPLVTRPTAPASLSVFTGPEEDFIHSGRSVVKRSESTLGYVRLAWHASTHLDGILGYHAQLTVLSNDDTENTGKTLTRTLWVGGGLGPVYTGVTFHNLTPGVKVIPKVQAISNASVPVMSTATTGTAFYIGAISSGLMPSIGTTQRVSGLDVAWDVDSAGTGTTGTTLFEVFASENVRTTGTTVNYNDLVYRGYGGKAFVPGDKGDVMYIKVRGIDYSGQLTGNYRISKVELTGPTAPTAPVNVRMTSISPIRTLTTEVNQAWQDANFSVANRGGNISSEAEVLWEWNWSSLEGTGGDAKLDVNNLAGVTLNQLNGLRLYLKTNSTDYIITGNTASSGNNTTIYVSSLLGVGVDLTGENPDSTDPAIVHCDADRYDVEFKQSTDEPGTLEIVSNRRQEQIFQRGTPPARQQIKRHQLIGTIQQITVRAYNKAASTPSTAVSSTTGRVSLPVIAAWNTGASIVAVGTEFGFRVTISPDDVIAQMSGLEFAYKQGSSGLSFTNRNHHPFIHGQVNEINVEIEQANTYQVGVRPLQGAQVVGDAKTAIVPAGGGGYLPNEKTLLTTPVNIVPLNQQLNWDTGNSLVHISGESGVVISAQNPATNVECKFFRATTGANNYIFYVQEHRYTLTGTLESFLLLREITNYGTPQSQLFKGYWMASGQTGYFGGDGTTGATNATTRQIASISVPNEIKITRLIFTSDYTDGDDANPAVIRVYQEAYPQGATSIEVNGYNVSLVAEADLDILRSRGPLIIKVDAYDPTAAVANGKILRGTLIVMYRDIAIAQPAASLFTFRGI